MEVNFILRATIIDELFIRGQEYGLQCGPDGLCQPAFRLILPSLQGMLSATGA